MDETSFGVERDNGRFLIRRQSRDNETTWKCCDCMWSSPDDDPVYLSDAFSRHDCANFSFLPQKISPRVVENGTTEPRRKKAA